MKDESPALPLAALRLWDDRARAGSGAWNMAVDEALLTGMAHSPVPVLRIYRWERPTLSFGYFLPLAEALAALSHGETLIRRWTGGGLVHHAAAVTWSLVMPHTEAFCRLRPGSSYLHLHLALAHALCGMGLQEISVVPAEAAVPTGGLCAEAPAPGDLLRYGRKLAGSGQRRTRQGLLHQGVIFLAEQDLVPDFPERLARVLAEEVTCFTPALLQEIPLARYENALWNARR
jgi:lipoate-protein ligase A